MSLNLLKPYDIILFKSGSNYIAHDQNGKTLSNNTNARTVLDTAINILTRTSPYPGGRIFVKNGVYPLGTNVQIGTTGQEGTQLEIVGESTENTIFLGTQTGINMFSVYCKATFRNVTMDGDGNTDILIASGQPVYINAYNCIFKKHVTIGVWLSDTVKGYIFRDNVFKEPGGWQDQMTFRCTEYGVVMNNVFDRTAVGTEDGSCLTSGGTTNAVVIGNKFLRRDDMTDESFGHGISLEPFGNNYDSIIIDSNILYYCRIRLGTNVADGEQWRRITITNNILNFGEIGIAFTDAPGDDYSNTAKYITVSNNQIFDAYAGALKLLNIAGPLVVNGNIIKDSNRSLSDNTLNDNGLLQVAGVSNAVISNNVLHMTDTTTSPHNASPYGIRYASTTNVSAFNNKVINVTANPSEAKGSGNTALITEHNNARHITFGWVGSSGGVSTYLLRYYSNNSQLAVATESTVQQTLPYAVRVKRVIVKMGANSLNANATIALRDDAADVTGTVLTLTAGSIAEVDSGPLDVVIASGSKINWKVDTSASASGSWQINSMVAYMTVDDAL